MLEHKRLHCHELVAVDRLSCVKVFTRLFDALAIPENGVTPEEGEHYPLMIEMWFLFCIIWSIGGPLDEDGRKKFDAFMREMDTRYPRCVGGAHDIQGVGGGGTTGHGLVRSGISVVAGWRPWVFPSYSWYCINLLTSFDGGYIHYGTVSMLYCIFSHYFIARPVFVHGQHRGYSPPAPCPTPAPPPHTILPYSSSSLH